MEGESPLLKDGALSLQTSLTHRELPPCPRRLGSENLFRFLRAARTWGKFLFGSGGMLFRVRLRTRLVGVSFPRVGTTHGSFPTMLYSQRFTHYTGAQSAGSAPQSFHAPRPPIGREAALCKKSAPPKPTKTSPQDPATMKSKTNFLLP